MVWNQMVKLCACALISDKLICHGAWDINLKFKKNSPIWSGTRWSEKLKDKK